MTNPPRTVALSKGKSRLSGYLRLIAALAVVGLICTALYLREANQTAGAMLDRENRRMEIFAGLFNRDIGDAVSDLRLMVSGDGLQSYVLSGQQADLDRAIRRAQFFSSENPDYDQIRYLDENGQELFRINRGSVIVPPNQLQNKADRPYFQKTKDLPPGQIYISNIDLNVEHGEIERPVKPMLRLAMPVFDANGQRHGVFVINILAANIIERLRVFVPQYAQRLRMLNSQGYWIKAARPEQEWGFMFAEKSDQTLAKTDPDLWLKILENPTGQEPYHGGYFTWYRMLPSHLTRVEPLTLVGGDEFLIMGSQVTLSEWNTNLARVRQTFVIVAALLLILTTVIMWFFQGRLRALQERDRFFAVTRDMLCIAGFDGRFLRVNPAWEKTLGYTKEELIGRPFIDFIHPEDREKTIEQTSRLNSGEEVLAFENRYRCKDGSYRWLLWSARPMVEDALIYGSARDLTERKQIEEKLQQSEERARLLVENVEDYAIIMLDPAGRVMSWNPMAERLKGYAAAEIIGEHFSRFYPEDKVREKFPDEELRQAADKGRYEDEGLRVRKDGTQFFANVIISAVRNSQGELIGFVKVSRDVTARREAAKRIEKLNEELKERADALETANKELESFSYSVSHDLRAPLRHIHGFVELLQKVPELEKDESSQRYMNVIAKAAKEMGHLIDDLLAFSRTGRAEMRPVKIKVREVIDQLIQDRVLDVQGRKISWDIKPLEPAWGDPALLRQVWANLIDNALKYTRPRDEAKIEIGQKAGEGAAAEDEIIYYIRDNGVGFDMRYASKLFGVFQRLHRPDQFEGTGIGLANVQRIIHRHGGRVWAESKIDDGAIFYFSLPITPQPTG
jgi:PAS domain S-box-containing protein